MTPELGLIVFLGLVLAYALVGRRLSDSVLTAPMIFLAGGYICAVTGLVGFQSADHSLQILAEVALVVLLFADAAMIDPRALWRGAGNPARMLLIGLPLVIAMGFGVGVLLLPGWPLWEIALIAALLAPTDAALGQSVITNPRIPERMRRALSAESGLNDGLALPFVVFFGCFAVGGIHDQVPTSWWVFVGEQIGLGALAGVAVGWAGAWLLRIAQGRGLSSDSLGGLAVLALAGLAYMLAHEIHGNGFIAAFVAGLMFGEVLRGRCDFVFEFIETEGQLLSVFAFFAIGALLLPAGFAHVTPALAVFVGLSLFLLRPAAIWLALAGTGTPAGERAFYGWFGPRGLATALFALLVLDSFENLQMRDGILATAALAVTASAFLHGATAAPAGRLFAPQSGAKSGGDATV